MSNTVLKGENIETGPLGDLELAQGDRVGLRIWKDYVTETKAERTRPYEIAGYVVKGEEIAGYVVKGEITLVVDGHATELVEGDSFVVPAQTSHAYRIPMPATVIEATAPPASKALS